MSTTGVRWVQSFLKVSFLWWHFIAHPSTGWVFVVYEYIREWAGQESGLRGARVYDAGDRLG